MKARTLARIGVVILAGGWVFVLPSLYRSREASRSAIPEESGAANQTQRPKAIAVPAPIVRVQEAAPDASAEEDEKPAFPAEFEGIEKVKDTGKQNRMLDKLFQEWVIRDAPGAADYSLTIKDEDLRRESLIRVMRTWAVQDPKAALSWARDAEFATSHEREIAMCMACSQVAMSDPPEALRLASEYQLDEGTEGLVEGLTSRWAETNLPAARDWVMSQPPGERRDSLIESIAMVELEANPAQAAQLVLEQIPAGESQNKTVLQMVSQMGIHDPEIAQTWVNSFPEGPLRVQALQDLDGIRNRQRDAGGQ